MVLIELPGTIYNIIHGTNRYALFWLGMLGLPPFVLGRFRDCYLQSTGEGEFEICVYTRNGGPYRARYVLATEMLRTHPLFLRDYDEAHDPTYAAYIFRPDDAMRQTIELIVARDPEHTVPGSHRQRSEEFLRKIDKPRDPDVRRVRAVMKSVQPVLVR